ncbi:MAG: hypothetical protein IH859_01420 [Chloroflexi bacterium]|nr:hypothetical protein [Chloroflexota bacterium]
MSLDLPQGVALKNLWRAFHPKYKYHRWVLWLVTAATAVAATASYLRGEDFFATLSLSFNSALASFIAWALARELDPDRETVSLLAIPFAATIIIIFGPVALLPSVVFIGSARFLTRITGLPPRRIEVLFILLLPLAIMLYYQNAVFGLLAAFTFGLEASFEKFPRKESLYTVFALLVTAAMIGYVGLPTMTSPGMLSGLIAGVISLLVVIKVVRLRQPQSRSDFNDQPIRVARLRAMMLLTMLIALMALAGGNSGFLLLAPVWAALFSTGI